MNKSTTLDMFYALSENVRALKKARTQLKLALNDSLRKNNSMALRHYTLLYALLYSAWAEANFQKLLFTPNSFSKAEIEKIEKKAKSGIGTAWIACLEIALPKVFGAKKKSFLPNARRKLSRLIVDNVVGPYELRNKIAHGQWVKATNSEYSSLHPELTKRLNSLDYVQVDRWFETYASIAHIVEMLIASPKKGFTNRYWVVVEEIEENIKEMSSWTIEERRKSLYAKNATFDQKQADQRELVQWAATVVIPALRAEGIFKIEDNNKLSDAVKQLLERPVHHVPRA